MGSAAAMAMTTYIKTVAHAFMFRGRTLIFDTLQKRIFDFFS